MTTITDLYRQLFGKGSLLDGDVIDFAEHGRVGGLSTGAGFKRTSLSDPDSGDNAEITTSNQLKTANHAFNDTNWHELKMDGTTRALTTIDFAHNEIHDGDHYFYTDTANLGSAATREYLITVADTDVVPHFLFDIIGSLKTTVDIFETTTKTGGMAQTVFNNDRRSANTAETVVTHTPAGSGDGTKIFTCTLGTATGSSGKGAGGGARGESEILLKKNTKYLIRVTSGAADNDICTKLTWYEHENEVV